LSLVVEFARSSFLIMLAHRLRYVVGVLNYMTYVAVNYYLWQALYESDGGKEKAGWTLAQMQTKVVIDWTVRSAYFSNSDNILAARINKGEITSDLLRPTSLFIQFYGSALGEAVFRAFFMALPVLGVALFVFEILPPAGFKQALLFTYSIALAFHLFFAINFMTGLLAAYTEKLQGFLWAKFMLMQFLTGLLLPLEFFPASLRVWFDWLPFKGIAYTPMMVYLGKLDGETLWRELALQTGWTIVLLLLCDVMWNRVRRRLSLLGG
jgi:ABC-2 type transport system permease protein